MVPLLAFLRFVYFEVAHARDVLGGAWGRNLRDIQYCALPRQHALGSQYGIESGQDLQAKFVSCEQMAIAQDAALIKRYSSPMSKPTNSRKMDVSYSDSSIVESDRLNHCLGKWK